MLTSKQREEYADALRAYLESLDHTALQRVASAEKWGDWHYCYPDGRRCLLGHAEDWQFNARTRCPVEPPGSLAGRCLGEDAFHELVDEDGLERTAAACRLYASCLLREREIASLEAFCPLAAREESLT